MSPNKLSIEQASIPRWVPLAILAMGQVLLLLVIAFCGDEGVGSSRSLTFLVKGLKFGLGLSQASLAAAWMVWGRLPIMLRLPFALIWAMLAGIAVAIGLDYKLEVRGFAVLVCVLMAVAQWALVAGMLGAAYRYGIELIFPEAEAEGAHLRRNQFQLRELLVLTAGVAIVLGIGRTFWPKTLLFSAVNADWDLATVLTLLLIGNLFLANALVTCFHVPRMWWANTLLILFVGAALTLIEAFTANRLLFMSNTAFVLASERPETYCFLLWINFCHAASLIGNMLALQACGYRLERVRDWNRPTMVGLVATVPASLTPAVGEQPE